MAGHILPAKVGGYLRRLTLTYGGAGQSFLRELVDRSRFYVREATSIDTDFGETSFGHDVVLFVPLSVLGSVSLNDDETLRERIRSDLNKCANAVPSEYIRAVGLEAEDEYDIEFQGSRTVSGAPATSPESLAFWKPGEIRLFVSHRDAHKREARSLGEALSQYGISAFIAHDTIEPLSTWRDEIRKGLETMEVMLAFVTDDFAESAWTNQEVGYALGKGVPIVSLQLQSRAPSGFIETSQAIKGRIAQPALSAEGIYKILADKLGNRERLQNALVAAFVASPDFNETKDRFDRMASVTAKLSDRELTMIVSGFEENDQLHKAGHLTSRFNRLLEFLRRTTGKTFELHGKTIREVKTAMPSLDDEMPF